MITQFFSLRLLICSIFFIGAAVPMLASAAAAGCTTDLCGIILSIFKLLNALIVLLMVVATLVFLWGIIKYLRAGGEDEIAEARGLILWGIIFLAVMVSVWGVVNLLVDFFFHTDTDSLLEGKGSIPHGPIQDAFPH